MDMEWQWYWKSIWLEMRLHEHIHDETNIFSTTKKMEEMANTPGMEENAQGECMKDKKKLKREGSMRISTQPWK